MIRRICYSLLKKILLLAKTISYLSLVRGENNLSSKSNGWLRSMRRAKNGDDVIRHNEIFRNWTKFLGSKYGLLILSTRNETLEFMVGFPKVSPIQSCSQNPHIVSLFYVKLNS